MNRDQIMKAIRLATGMMFALLMSSNAFAVVIATPVDYDTDNLVGTADPGTTAGTAATETEWANYILAMSFNTIAANGGVDYRTHNTDEYAGTLLVGDYVKTDITGHTDVGAGFDYVLGKYDGQSAGYILFYLGGEASTIPEYSDNIWVNGQDNGYQISHWAGWRVTTDVPVPEPGTLVLFGVGLLGIGLARRRRKV
jgi:hypothetical protein